jgi:hypothetical protein
MAGGGTAAGHYQYNASMLPIASKLLVQCEIFVDFVSAGFYIAVLYRFYLFSEGPARPPAGQSSDAGSLD